MRRNLLFFSVFGLVALALIAYFLESPARLETASPLTARTAPRPSEMTAFTIQAGRHLCLPQTFRRYDRPERVSWLVRFGENGAYDLGDVDQDDWNKLVGLFFNLFDTMDNTVMVGWRWNLETERMELNAYFHDAGERSFTKTLLDIGLGEPLRIDISVDYGQKRYSVALERLADGKRVRHSEAFTHDRTVCYEINTFFGGNRPAPREVTVYKGYLD